MVFAGNTWAQNIIEAGTIEYERKVNIHKINRENEWFQKMKDQVAVYHTSYFDLVFNADKALYKPGKETVNNVGWFAPPASADVILTDFKSGKVTASKSVFEESYLIKDTMRTMKWKITNEFRNIAGYDCRKAVGTTFDSVIVVAFYCDRIAASVGPQRFSGLPGAILGLAIPRMYTHWFATKVTVAKYGEPQPAMEEPKKGKETTDKKIEDGLRTSLKDWGPYVNNILWFVLL